MTARERIATAALGTVHPLEGEKATRFRAQSMLIPSPSDVRDVIVRIPEGRTRSLREIREELAAKAGADVTCPRAAALAWILIAEAADEAVAEGTPNATPWWRVTRDRKPERRLPGGEARHRALLAAEGIEL